LAQEKSGPIRRRRDRRGHVQVEEKVLEGNSPKGRPVVRQGCTGEMAPRQSEEEESWDGSNLTIVFQDCLLL
jgi:hypothetical protein